MSKRIERDASILPKVKISFVDKRTTLKEEIDGHITYYDLVDTLIAAGNVSPTIRGHLHKHITDTEIYYTLSFHRTADTYYINYYCERM